MLIRKIQKNKKNQIYKKERSWGTKFENLAIFLPINTSLYNTQKGGRGGNFTYRGKTQKKPNPKAKPKTYLYQTAASRPLTKPTAPLSPGFDFFLPSRRSQPHITQNTAATATAHPIFFSLTPIAPSPSSPESPSLSSSLISLHQATHSSRSPVHSLLPPKNPTVADSSSTHRRRPLPHPPALLCTDRTPALLPRPPLDLPKGAKIINAWTIAATPTTPPPLECRGEEEETHNRPICRKKRIRNREEEK
jgi:hypothetical protein